MIRSLREAALLLTGRDSSGKCVADNDRTCAIASLVSTRAMEMLIVRQPCDPAHTRS